MAAGPPVEVCVTAVLTKPTLVEVVEPVPIAEPTRRLHQFLKQLVLLLLDQVFVRIRDAVQVWVGLQAEFINLQCL